jgi:3-methyladenine DNA glycosylase AlkC
MATKRKKSRAATRAKTPRKSAAVRKRPDAKAAASSAKPRAQRKQPNQPRTGASRIADIPPEILEQLNRGAIEAKTLAENLAIDCLALFETVFPRAPAERRAAVAAARSRGVLERTRMVGAQLAELGADAIEAAAGHTSDTVRGWAAFATTRDADSFAEALRRIKRFADDPNAGVREWAWMTVRDQITRDAQSAIELLVPWTRDGSPNVRRFASEATRPRGVWAAHIAALRENPALGLPILENLKADPSRYVQNSVGNWLNDAAKDQADWVRGVTKRWLNESGSAATAYIVKRALRGLA